MLYKGIKKILKVKISEVSNTFVHQRKMFTCFDHNVGYKRKSREIKNKLATEKHLVTLQTLLNGNLFSNREDLTIKPSISLIIPEYFQS